MTTPPNHLICFDTDGIFKSQPWYTDEDQTWFKDGYVAGPVDPQFVKNKVLPLADVYIVSESPFYPKEPDGKSMFTVINHLPSRYLNLQEAYNTYWEKYEQEPLTKLYVSNNGDYIEATKAEFTYIRHDIFFKSMEGLTN